MPNEYEFDAVRWLRNNKGRIGTNRINGDDIATAIADEIQRLRAEADTLRNESEFYRKQCDMRDEWRDKIEAELAALKEAARPVVAWYKSHGYDNTISLRRSNEIILRHSFMCGRERRTYDVATSHLDALAALVGEE